MLNRLASHAIQQAFLEPCLVNLISKDIHLIFSIYVSFQNIFFWGGGGGGGGIDYSYTLLCIFFGNQRLILGLEIINF